MQGWKPLGTAGRDTSYCPLSPGAQQSCTFEQLYLAPAGLLMGEEEEEGKLCCRSSCRRAEAQMGSAAAITPAQMAECLLLGDEGLPPLSRYRKGLEPPGQSPCVPGEGASHPRYDPEMSCKTLDLCHNRLLQIGSFPARRKSCLSSLISFLFHLLPFPASLSYKHPPFPSVLPAQVWQASPAPPPPEILLSLHGVPLSHVPLWDAAATSGQLPAAVLGPSSMAGYNTPFKIPYHSSQQ